jgi:hypothetical protein
LREKNKRATTNKEIENNILAIEPLKFVDVSYRSVVMILRRLMADPVLRYIIFIGCGDGSDGGDGDGGDGDGGDGNGGGSVGWW